MRARFEILAPSGRLDSGNSSAFEEEVMEKLDDAAGGLVFDFADLDYVSSAGLRIVLLTAKRMRKRGARFVLCGLSPSIRDVFKISGLLSVLTIEPDRRAALGHFDAISGPAGTA